MDLCPPSAAARGPAPVGAIGSALTAYLAIRFLMRLFETNRLTPFAIYCLIAGTAATHYFALACSPCKATGNDAGSP